MVHDLARAGAAVEAGEHARVGGGVDDEVGGRQRVDLGGVTEVGGNDLHAEFLQRLAVGLAAGADEVVEAEDPVAAAGLD